MKKSRIVLLVIGAVLLAAVMFLSTPAAQAHDANWRAEYYRNTDLSGNPSRVDYVPTIDIEWGDRTVLPDGVRRENMSIRWTRTVNFGTAGTYRFHATMDDGMRVWVDNALIIDQWHTGQSRTYTADRYMSSGDHALRVEFFNGPLTAIAKFWWEFLPGVPAPPPSFQGWRGEYYNNSGLQGSPVLVRDDPGINFNWSTGSPQPGVVNSDFFSVRWTRNLNLNAGRYRFDAATDDGVRVWVNNILIIDRWINQPITSVSGEISIAGGTTPVRMEYYDHTGYAQAHLGWTQLSGTTPPPSTNATATVISASLNIRQGPGPNFPVLTTVGQGATVWFAGYRNASGTWVQVTTASGVTGWAYSPLLSTSFPIMSLPVWTGDGTPPPDQPVGVVVGARYLNVRSAPSMSGTVITTIRGGTQVTLIGRDAGIIWLKVVLSNGTQGWVGAGYIQTSYPVNQLPVLSQ